MSSAYGKICLDGAGQDLSDNDLSYHGAKGIAKGLQCNAFLTDLDISHNAMGENGGRAMAEMLRINATLVKVVSA